MLDRLFHWFFELIVGCLTFILLVRLVSIGQLCRALGLVARLLLLQLALFVVEIEYEVQDGFVFTILADSFVDLMELTDLRCILQWLLLLSAHRYTLLLAIRLFLPFLAIWLGGLIVRIG